jgi:hypothetical protein
MKRRCQQEGMSICSVEKQGYPQTIKWRKITTQAIDFYTHRKKPQNNKVLAFASWKQQSS